MVRDPFFLYLVEQAFLTEHEARDIEEAAAAESSRLGRMLLRDRAVSIKQMTEVVRRLPTSSLRIGDLVVEMGFASRETVERVAAKQPEARLDRFDLLMERGPLDRDDLYEAMLAYLRHEDDAAGDR